MKILINEKISPHRYKDNHGYLICTDCIMARTGKQTYTRDECFGDGDSTEIEVDRPSKEVFDAKTMASFENVPITIEHPSVNVDPDNYNTLSVGHMRDIRKGTYEGQPVMVGTAVITDSEAIEKVESGELTNLSCGYDCDIDDSDAPHQFNIRGNHIALCECPRAGITHIQDSKKDTKKKYEVTLESEDTMRDLRTRRRVRDDEDWQIIYVELTNGDVEPYEYDANEESENEAVNEIVEALGEDGEGTLVAIYSDMTDYGPFGELYRDRRHSIDSRRRVTRDAKRSIRSIFSNVDFDGSLEDLAKYMDSLAVVAGAYADSNRVEVQCKWRSSPNKANSDYIDANVALKKYMAESDSKFKLSYIENSTRDEGEEFSALLYITPISTHDSRRVAKRRK